MRLKDEFKIDQGYKIDPRRLTVDPGWNARHDTPELREANAELKESIRALGVQEPLTVYVRGEEIVVTNGHRRLAMTMELIAEGVEIDSVPSRIEAGAGEADRCLSMLTRNSGLRLTPLETAEVIKRLIGYGWDADKIKTRTGFSGTYVARMMTLLESPQQILDAVGRGDVSASLAVQVQQDSPADAPRLLQEAGVIAKAAGAPKITPKHVKAAQAARNVDEATPEQPNWAKVGPKLLHHLDAILAKEDGAARRARAFRKTLGE